MAQWQNNELAGLDIHYIVTSHADYNGGSIEANEILAWPNEHGFTYDSLLLDNGQVIMNQYTSANPGPNYTQAVTVIIGKDMRIRKVGGTYDTNHNENLQLLLQLVNE